MQNKRLEVYTAEDIKKIPKRKVSINGRIDSKDYLELALEATTEYYELFPHEQFDVKKRD